MRMLTLLVAVATLTPSLAEAKRARAKADARLTFVEDEPMSPAAGQAPAAQNDPTAPSGTRMEVSVRAPEVTGSGQFHDGVAAHALAAPVARADEGGDTTLLDELVARQISKTRQNAASIDACTAEVVRRHPTTNGTVRLSVAVADNRVQSAHVVADSIHDIELDGCLVKAALGWKLRLATTTFIWPVTVSPSASR